MLLQREVNPANPTALMAGEGGRGAGERKSREECVRVPYAFSCETMSRFFRTQVLSLRELRERECE